jgi:polyribonucleotide nucleotidyltransferase
VSKYAPKMAMVNIDPAKIGLVIGSGGKTIKEIQESTGSIINIDEDGTVVVTADTEEAAQKAASIIAGLVKEVKVGEIYEGRVSEIVDFGAFVEILPGKDGLLHVSEIAHGFVKNVRDYLKEGDPVTVKVLAVNEGKISLSKKALESAPEGVDTRDDRDGGFSRPSRGSRPGRTDRGRSGGGGYDRRR